MLICLSMVGELVGATRVIDPMTLRLSAPTTSHPVTGAPPAEIDRLEHRLERVEAEGRWILSYHAEHVEPLISFLEPRVRDHRENLPRIAIALVKEGHRVGVDPRLLGGVLLIENPWLDPSARSPVGAVGIMQVMPFHAGDWGCGRSDLTHIETNVCHGTRILAEALRSTNGDMDAALLRYNGCRHGTNTPDCRTYPDRVYEHVGRGGPAGSDGTDAR